MEPPPPESDFTTHLPRGPHHPPDPTTKPPPPETDDTTIPIPRGPHRRICPGCSRPTPVCLCPFLPQTPIPTKTQVLIVQHPHESRHKLSTTPLLLRCLSNSSALISRRLHPSLLPPIPSPAIYLFPAGPTAIPLSALPFAPSLVIAFDATWRHAREMVAASEGYLGQFATRVCLDGYDEGAEGGSIYDSALALRKEPCGGCVSTAEAVARALGKVEGPEVEERIVGVLREMVRLQAQFLKPVKPRPKLGKKEGKKRVET